MKLVIVESPNKVRKISGYLGSGYQVMASFGHVRDLPSDGGLSIAFAGGRIKPSYEVRAKRDLVAKLKAAAAAADEVILASDPDREGESIAWHLTELLGPKRRYRRVTFNAITEDAIRTAMAAPRDIDRHLVDAQQARRVLDRVVGWLVSPTCRTGTGNVRAVSAGRVQSVALRCVVDREREISGFQAQAFHIVGMKIEKPGVAPPFWTRLVRWGEKEIPRGVLRAEDAAMIIERTKTLPWRVLTATSTRQIRNPPPPFTTATCQQAASIALGLTPEQTMALLQELFEAGSITYHRSDSVSLSPEAIAFAREIITKRFPPAYLPAKPNSHAAKSANTQEAHEAIRPTHPQSGPEAHGSTMAGRLYQLIWQRFIGSQMAPEVNDVTVLDVGAGEKAVFRARGVQPVFDGWRHLTEDATEEDRSTSSNDEESGSALPVVAAGDEVRPVESKVAKSSTKPPPRYTQASLVKKLDTDGIGRPSTYATILKGLLSRGYIEDKAKRLYATQLGCTLVDFLAKAYQGNFIEFGFTAQMEEDLDRVARGERSWEPLITEASQTLLRAAQAAGLPYNPLVGEERSVQPHDRRDIPSGGTPKPCRTCGKPIHLLQEAGKWVVLNLDGTPHRDQRSQRG